SLAAALERLVTMGSLMRERLRVYFDEMRDMRSGDRLAYVGRKLRSLGAMVARRHAWRGVWREFKQREVYLANLRALDRYRRRPTPRWRPRRTAPRVRSTTPPASAPDRHRSARRRDRAWPPFPLRTSMARSTSRCRSP